MELTTVQYNPDARSATRLHIYESDQQHYRSYWFARTIRFPDEEVPLGVAKQMALQAIASGREVRITDGGDHLCFHAHNGKVVYPADYSEERFWEEAARRS